MTNVFRGFVRWVRGFSRTSVRFVAVAVGVFLGVTAGHMGFTTTPAPTFEGWAVVDTSVGGNRASGELRYRANCAPIDRLAEIELAGVWPMEIPTREVAITAAQANTLTHGDPCPET